MMAEQLLDLDSRKGKAPGGYCETLHYRGRPFIFMNAVGVLEDVSTLLHEGGHAFHAFAARQQPLIWQRHPGLEMCELASMSMELLAAPYLERRDGGFFDSEDYRRARVEHLEDVLLTLSHVASVDAFQSWLYTSGEGGDRDGPGRGLAPDPQSIRAGSGLVGLERERVARWYRQLHIFLHPFYYIEYGLAQIGALQVWRNSMRDPAEAVRRYRAALALGATRSLPELYPGGRGGIHLRCEGDRRTGVAGGSASWSGWEKDLPAPNRPGCLRDSRRRDSSPGNPTYREGTGWPRKRELRWKAS